MVKVVGIDHLSIRVSSFTASKAFYGRLFPFLGFEVLDEHAEAIGWTNGKTRYWIGQSEPERRAGRAVEASLKLRKPYMLKVSITPDGSGR